jgi:hypothetical protein
VKTLKKPITLLIVLLSLGLLGVAYSVSQLQTSWNYITVFTGSSSQTTNPFIAPNGHIRIDEFVKSNSSYSLGIMVHEKDGAGTAGLTSNHLASSDGRLLGKYYTTLHDSSNEYFLEINAGNIESYTLVVFYDGGLQFSPIMSVIFMLCLALSLVSCTIIIQKKKSSKRLPNQ